MVYSRVTVDSRKSRLGVALAALAFYAVFLYRTSFVLAGTRIFVLFEDAMISMRYARNLAEGHGLVWNVGEEPIEGFTNLLWVLWMAVGHKLGLSEAKISLFIMLTGVCILLANGLVVAKVARRLTDASWVPLAVLAATLFDYPLVFWTLRGMEVGALTLLVNTLLWLVLENEEKFSMGRTVLMSVLTASALLLRSDSVVPIGLIGLYGLYTAEKRVLFALTLAAGAGGAVGAQTAFRITYFHDRLPNTAYLKLIGIPLSARIKRGIYVALEVLAMHLAVPLAIVAARLGAPDKAFYKDKATRRRVLLGALFFAQIGYFTYVGGDAWEWMLYANRYACVGMPALIVLVAVCLDDLVKQGADEHAKAAKRFALGIAAMGLVLVALNLYGKVRPEVGVARTIYFSKTPFALGGAFVGLGLAFYFLRDLREGIVEALGFLRSRVATRPTVVAATLVAVALVWFPSHATALGRWATQNAAQYLDEARYTRLGFLLRATTPDDHRIAVAAAGATPYFSRRPTEDLLGKNDKHIARLLPKGVFSPGHDKWDYEWSLGTRKSQLIVEPVDLNDAEQKYIDELGFKKLPNEMLLRDGAPGVDPALVGATVDTVAELEEVLTKAKFTFPEPVKGNDLGIAAVLSLLALGLVFATSKDGESFAELEENAPEPTPGPSADGHNHIQTLDGLRGIAVLLVLVFHFAWEFPEGGFVVTQVKRLLFTGWIGVDLFFVLSGFLITRGLVAPSKKPIGTRLKLFWMRRVLRIFPLYYAFIIVGSIIGLALGGWIPGAAYWLYMQNYTLAFDDHELRWTAHFWSLAIEEQFYFVWPAIALLTPKRRLIGLTVGLIVACIVFRAGFTLKSHVWDPLTIVKFAYRATFSRADGLLLGALVAILQRESSHPLSHLWRRLRFPIFVLTGLAILGLHVVAKGLNGYDRRVIAAGYLLLSLFFASAVSMCSDDVITDRMRRFLSSKVLVSCGKVSYGMYIFHWPLLAFAVPYLKAAQEKMGVGAQVGLNVAFITVAITLIWAAGQLSFRFFESPFLKLKEKFHG